MGFDLGSEPISLSEFLPQIVSEALHLFAKRLAVVLHFGRTDISTRRQDVAVFLDVIERGSFAEAQHVPVPPRGGV